MVKNNLNLLEKIILTSPVPFLTIYTQIYSKIEKDKYCNQSLIERFNSIHNDKYKKYKKLFNIKKKYNIIPKKIIKLNKKTLCGKSRLYLVNLR